MRARSVPLAWAAFTCVLLVFPLVLTNPAYTSIAVFTLLFMVSATAWNSFAGYSGYIPLGSGAFYGTGAYTLALLAARWHLSGGYGVFLLVPVAGLAAAAVALPFGFVALRTRRHTFVVITIAIFFIFQLLAYNLGFTGGSSGVQTPTPPWSGSFFNLPFYYVSLALVGSSIGLSWAIRRSRFGLQLLAIRDDEDRARGLGVRVGRIKLAGFVVSAVPIGMAGAVYAYFVGQIFPQFVYDPVFDISVALMAFLGGLGTISGPLLGALLLEPIQQYLTLQFSVQSLYLVIYGALFLGVILLMPRGLVPSAVEWWRRRRTRPTEAGVE
ncbi:MAG: branched-chain amino acid ABC transporter permease [Candidatus Dormibacteraeota bacterium]|nr:branched-chain amino acid ABC transporter permease [Candidatus Dormibacteraeota bacterium]